MPEQPSCSDIVKLEGKNSSLQNLHGSFVTRKWLRHEKLKKSPAQGVR